MRHDYFGDALAILLAPVALVLWLWEWRQRRREGRRGFEVKR